MNCIQQIHELVWVDPPEFTFGLYSHGYNWALQVMTKGPNGNNQKEVHTVWAGQLDSLSAAFHCGAIVYRLAAYLQEVFKKLTPNYNTLIKWIRKLAEENKLTESEMTSLNQTLDGIIGLNASDPSNNTNDKSNSCTESKDEVKQTKLLLQIQEFCADLEKRGYTDIKFVHQVSIVFNVQPLINSFSMDFLLCLK